MQLLLHLFAVIEMQNKRIKILRLKHFHPDSNFKVVFAGIELAMYKSGNVTKNMIKKYTTHLLEG